MMFRTGNLPSGVAGGESVVFDLVALQVGEDVVLQLLVIGDCRWDAHRKLRPPVYCMARVALKRFGSGLVGGNT